STPWIRWMSVENRSRAPGSFAARAAAAVSAERCEGTTVRVEAYHGGDRNAYAAAAATPRAPNMAIVRQRRSSTSARSVLRAASFIPSPPRCSWKGVHRGDVLVDRPRDHERGRFYDMFGVAHASVRRRWDSTYPDATARPGPARRRP